MVIRMIKIAFYHQEVYEYCYHKQTMHPQKNADMVLSSSHACCQILQVFDKTSDFAIKNIAQLHPVCFFSLWMRMCTQRTFAQVDYISRG